MLAFLCCDRTPEKRWEGLLSGLEMSARSCGSPWWGMVGREVRSSGHHGGSPWWGREKSASQAIMVGARGGTESGQLLRPSWWESLVGQVQSSSRWPESRVRA